MAVELTDWSMQLVKHNCLFHLLALSPVATHGQILSVGPINMKTQHYAFGSSLSFSPPRQKLHTSGE